MKREYKKHSILILLVLLFTTFVLLLNGCGKKVSLDGASFSVNSVSMEKYESYTLELNGCDSKDVTWKSEDKSIAEVKDGVVYAKKKGTTEVAAWIGKSSISCTVSVSDNQYVPVIELSEPDTGIKMGEGGTYTMSPVLSYNGNIYEDAKYEYVAIDDVVEVDKTGVITATELGEGLVAVTAKWRGNVIETSLPVEVVDITTSIEVSDIEYEIYLNGKGGDEPGSADLGIIVFDDKVQVKNPYASVTYVEQPREGDVKGAASINKGVVYPRKYGTTHFVAVYKSKAGELYYSAEFAVTVKQTLTDYYMTPIRGEEFEFFIRPLDGSGTNFVEWDEKLQAYHLNNRWKQADNSRGFIFDKQHLEGIIENTNVTSITFEYRTDGIIARPDDKEDIFTGYWPRWYVPGTYSMLSSTTDKWIRKTVKLDELPLDEDGSIKTVFLLNAAAGMYIRNITLNVGTGKIDYSSFDYMAPIQGKAYEFFIQPLEPSGANYVEWDEKEQAYHLFNNCSEANDYRGFIFDKQYLEGIIKNTDVTSITFEYRTDGIKARANDKEDIFTGYWPRWYVAGEYSMISSTTDKWIRKTVKLDELPTHTDGSMKTVFILNAAAGMYVRNITLNVGAGEVDYSKFDYTAPIQGKEYEFFIQPVEPSGANYVEWDEKEQAYHLFNNCTEANDNRGFYFDKQYLEGIIANTQATSISFEYRTDGIIARPDDKEDIFEGYWPRWYVAGQYKMSSSDTDTWISTTIDLGNIPRDADGNIKTIFLLNAAAGMYVRNIRVNIEYNYTADIEGNTYEFFIQALGNKNSVKWDEAANAYHLINKEVGEDNNRGFIFNKEYLEGIIANTNADSISFEYRTDGILSGVPNVKEDIYEGYWPNWYVDGQFKKQASTTDKWITATIDLKNIPRDTDGSIKTIFLMNAAAGMYVRNIRVNIDYTADIKGEGYEFFIRPVDTTGANYVEWDETEKAYHLIHKWQGTTDDTRGFYFDRTYLEGIIANTEATHISFEFRTDGIPTGTGATSDIIFYGYYPGSREQGFDLPTSTTDAWIKKTVSLADLPTTADGRIKAPFLLHAATGMYVRNIRLTIPSNDVDYDSLDYMAPIQGEAYEFLFKPVDISGSNSVKWDADKQAYHFVNTYPESGVERAVYLDVTYLEKVIANTNATKIIFEYQSDQSLISADHKFYYYYGVPGTWNYTWRSQEASTDTTKWYTEEIVLADLPKNADGSIQTWCLRNNGAGLYIRNIRLDIQSEPSNDVDYDNLDYTAPIQGETYEFLLKPVDVSGSNSVKWDEDKQAFHFINKYPERSLDRGVYFDTTYLEKLIANTNATKITFEYQSDQDLIDTDHTLYYYYYSDQANFTFRGLEYNKAASTDTTKWYTEEIVLANLPKTADGKIMSWCIRNNAAGLYIRNIKLDIQSEPSDDENYDNFEYAPVIEGEKYEFIIRPVDTTGENYVEWDATEQAYHLVHGWTGEADDNRGFYFDRAYLEGLMKNTNATTISFEYRTDGISAGNGSTSTSIFYGYYPETRAQGFGLANSSTSAWLTWTIRLEDLPKHTDGRIKTPFLLHAATGMYIRNIRVNIDYTADIEGEDYEFFIRPVDTTGENYVEWDATEQAYHLVHEWSGEADDNRGFYLDRAYLEGIMKYTDATYISFEYRTDGISAGNGSTSTSIFYGYYPETRAQGFGLANSSTSQWLTWKIKLADLPMHTDGRIKTPFLLHGATGMYVKNITLE